MDMKSASAATWANTYFTMASGSGAGYSQEAIPLLPPVSPHNAQTVSLLFLSHLSTHTCTLQWFPVQEGYMAGEPLGDIFCPYCVVWGQASL